MSVANALAFLRQVRVDEALRRKLADLPRPARAEALCALAADEGRPCEPPHLNEAFRIEWAARWAHFGRRREPQ